MNMLKKLSTGAVLGVLALTSAGCAQTHKVSDVAFSAFATATTQVSRQIAADLTVELRKALNAPRAVRVRTSPTVLISDAIEPGMESVIVVATRLPIETVIVAATRLPVETIVVAATRLPALVDPTEILQTIRTAQVRL